MGFKVVLGILIIYIFGTIAGVGISSLATTTSSYGPLSLPVILLFLFILIVFLIYASSNFNNKNKVFGLILIVFFISGFLITSTKTSYVSPFKEHTGRLVDLEGMVSGYLVYSNRTVYWLESPVIYIGDERVVGNKRQERIQLSIYEPTFNYSYGTVVRVREILREASPRRNPGGFDFREFLARRNIFAVVNAQEHQVIKVGERTGNPLLRAGLGMRERFSELSHNLIEHEGGIFRALILGEKSGITPEDRNIYQGIGVMHIFAVSGLHVGFVMFLLFGIASIFRKPSSSTIVPPPPAGSKDISGGINTLLASFFSTNNIINMVIILCLLVYCAAIGFPTPVMRASIMLGIFLWGRENWNSVQTANSLFLAALLLLLLNPLMIFDAGFQLSFIATAFIIFLTPILKTNKYLKKDWLAIPLAAWLGTVPLIAYYFNIFAPLGIVTAMPSGFMAGGAVILGFIAFVLDFISPQFAQFLMTAVGGIVFYSNYILHLFAKLPLIGDGIPIATPSIPAIFLYYFIFILVCVAYHHRQNPHLRFFIIKKKYKPIIALILVCIIVVLSFQAFTPSYLEVIFLDVGQGDCALIITPSGRVVLIDGGGMSGNHNFGDLVVVPFLRHLGIKKVDVVISTHPHTDHVAGLYPVLRQFPVDLVLIPEGFDEWYEYLKEIVNDRGLNYAYARRGQTITLEPNIHLNIIHPSIDYPITRGVNNHSIVAELTYNNVSFLFTGDIEMDAMNYMLPHISQSNVLQFPHHGSANTSFNTNYLERVNPEIVIIQVGLNNPFGHPGRVILEYFADKDIPVYRSDLHGAITIYSRGQEINRIETVIR